MKRNKKKFYKSKNYSNPFFDKKNGGVPRNKKIEGRKKSPIKYLVVLLIIMLSWFLFFSSFFNIKSITVSGQGTHTSEIKDIGWDQLKSSRFLFGSQRNINLFNKKELVEELNEKYYFDELIIKKDLPDTISINFKERDYILIWLESDNYHYIDYEGNIIKQTATTTPIDGDHPIIDNQTKDSVLDRKVMGKSDEISYISQLLKEYKEQRIDIVIDRFVVDNDINTVKILLNSGTMVYFNILEDVNKQLLKLIKIKEEKLKDNFDAQVYIDLRYGDKVYYK